MHRLAAADFGCALAVLPQATDSGRDRRMASDAPRPPRRPAFIFSYNDTDEDVAALVADSEPSTSRSAYAGLGLADTHARARTTSRARYGEAPGEDDWVPTYGPTTYRRGKMRFVPARDPQFRVLEGLPGPPQARADEPRAEEPSPRQEDRASGISRPFTTVPGEQVRSLYASIVGLDRQAGAIPTATHSAPASRRPTSPVSKPPPPPEAASTKRPRTASPPVRAFEPARWQLSEREADIVLSSDEDDDDTEGRSPDPKVKPESDAVDDSEEDADLVVIDPRTGLPEQAAPKRTKVQPLLIHQLLPSARQQDGSFRPFAPPTQYAIKPDSPGWKLLARQGWKEGLPLGPTTPAVEGATASTSAADAARLKIPLRAIEKRDRGGIGTSSRADDSGTDDEQRRKLVVGALGPDQTRKAREERERERKRAEREARERRGRGERGMAKKQQKEERERRAWIAYMNR